MAHILVNVNFKDVSDENSTTAVSSGSIQTLLSKTARFWILLAFEIPSLICCIFLLYNLLLDRKLRTPLHNHIMIAVLIFTFFLLIIDIPNYMTFLRLGYVWPSTPFNCYTWSYMDNVGYYGLGILMAWASIERHILVFHRHWLITTKQLIFLHYIPLASVILYPCIFYAIFVFFLPCEEAIDFTHYLCSVPCAYSIETLAMLDGFIHGDTPTILITIFNILLVIRIIRQKQRINQQIQWRKHRRVTIQLIACSTPFIFLNLPLVCIYIAQFFGVPYGATGLFELIFYFLAYFIIIGMPFLCLLFSHEVVVKTKNMLKLQHFNNTITQQPTLLN